MTQKILWADTETTGTEPKQNALIQLAAIIEIDGHVAEEVNLLMAPKPHHVICQEALAVNKRSYEEICQFPPLEQGIDQFKSVMGKYVGRYDRADKFVMRGCNVGFDHEFIYTAFKTAGDKYGFGTWVFNVKQDVHHLVCEAILQLKLRLPNYKLKTLCDYFGVAIDAHDAMSDIRATRELYYKLENLLMN